MIAATLAVNVTKDLWLSKWVIGLIKFRTAEGKWDFNSFEYTSNLAIHRRDKSIDDKDSYNFEKPYRDQMISKIYEHYIIACKIFRANLMVQRPANHGKMSSITLDVDRKY